MRNSLEPEHSPDPRPHHPLRLLLSGFMMGAADVVPGVSGGTIAFIVGIYEDLLGAIRALDFGLVRLLLRGQIRAVIQHPSWRFLIPLGAGIFLAILTVSHSLVWALERYPELIWAFFFGLVLASVLVVSKRIRHWRAAVVLLTALGAAAAYWLVGLVPMETPTAPWFLFLSGALAISAMILPGISGAFILLILGKYEYLLGAVVSGNWLPLVIVAAGAGVGLLSFARLLHWLFQHHHDFTVAVLIGLVLGALRRVWPWKNTLAAPPGEAGANEFLLEVNVLPAALTWEVVAALLLMAAGFGVVLLLEYYGQRKKTKVSTPAA